MLRNILGLTTVLTLMLLLQACGATTPDTPTPAPAGKATSKPAKPLPPAANATVGPGAARVKGALGFAPTPVGCLAAGNADLESQVLDIVNSERGKLNPPLPALTANAQLTLAARNHSADQSCNDNLDHTGSNGSSPGDRITAAGYNFRTWGENIAAGQATAAEVMNSWKNSPGHWANITSPNFTEIGVGYMAVPNGTPYWTQVFAAPAQ